jgi:hypothetical protein
MTARRGVDLQWSSEKGPPGGELQKMIEQVGETICEVVGLVRRAGMLEQAVIVVSRVPDQPERIAVGAITREKLRHYSFLSKNQRAWLDEPNKPGAIFVFVFGDNGSGTAELRVTDFEEN